MSGDDLISLLVAVGLSAWMAFVLVFPERF
jgi:hypothetical protein